MHHGEVMPTTFCVGVFVIKNKMVLSVSYVGLAGELLKEINRLAAQQSVIVPIRSDHFTPYYINAALQKIIDYSYGKYLQRSRTWRNINPIIYESVRDNAAFLNLDIAYAERVNYYENEINYFWSKNVGEPLSYRVLEDDLLAEIHLQCPYLLIDETIEKFVINTIDTLVEVFIPEYFVKQGSSYSLIHQFKDNYLEVYKNLRHQHFMVVINEPMSRYIHLLAERELEMSYGIKAPEYYGTLDVNNGSCYQDYAIYG